MSEFVERPSGPSARCYLPTADLIATVTNGQAVRLLLDGRHRVTIANASVTAARRLGYRSRCRLDGDLAQRASTRAFATVLPLDNVLALAAP